MWLLLTRTRWGTLVRAATQDREMVGALGIDQAKLFTSVFFARLGAGRSGRRAADPARAGQSRARPFRHRRRLRRHRGRWSRQHRRRLFGRLLIGVPRPSASASAPSTVRRRDRLPQAHPGGRLPDHGDRAGRAPLRPVGQAAGRRRASPRDPAAAHRPSWTLLAGRAGAAARVPIVADRYVTILLTDIFCFALFAVSLHFMMGPAGMVSFGHAAYFGLGAYAAALMLNAAACRWSRHCAGAAGRRRLRRRLSAGSACGCRASTSPC